MTLTRASLSSFLSSAKSLLSNPSKPLTFVIGNESADLDSICSALVLAYVRTYAPKSQSFYIPLSNLPRADLSLRPELIPVLNRADLKPSDLVTLSDLPQGKVNDTKWVLVDHNALQGELGKRYDGNVVGCVDHHDEENRVPRETGEEPRIVEKCGSCASLVVRFCRETWDALSAEDRAGDEQLAALAVAPILIDTQALKSESKTVDVDKESVGYLEGKAGAGFDREGYFKEIQEAKEDIGGLPLADILRKDYKQWTEKQSFNIGISSVVQDMSFLIDKAGGEEELFRAIKDFAEELGLEICSIMTTSHPDGIFKRELFVWVMSEKGIQAVKRFEAESGEELGLAQWQEGRLDLDGEKQFRRCWQQKNLGHSRKHVAPHLRRAVNAE